MIISQDNKRDFFRMLINAECELVVSQPSGTSQIVGVCKDMSATGMAVQRDVEIPSGAAVEVSIESQNSHFASLQASCKAVRSERYERDGYLTGLEVISFDS